MIETSGWLKLVYFFRHMMLKVDSQGKLEIRGRKWQIGQGLAGEWVQIIEIERRMQIYYCNTLIRELELDIHRSTIVERWISFEAP